MARFCAIGLAYLLLQVHVRRKSRREKRLARHDASWREIESAGEEPMGSYPGINVVCFPYLVLCDKSLQNVTTYKDRWLCLVDPMEQEEFRQGTAKIACLCSTISAVSTADSKAEEWTCVKGSIHSRVCSWLLARVLTRGLSRGFS